MVKVKVEDLKVDVIKLKLAELGLPSAGQKADLVSKLKEVLGTDEAEIESDNLRESDRDQEVNLLRSEIEELKSSLAQVIEAVFKSQDVPDVYRTPVAANHVSQQTTRTYTTESSYTPPKENKKTVQSPDVMCENSIQRRPLEYEPYAHQNHSMQNIKNIIEILPEFDPYAEE